MVHAEPDDTVRTRVLAAAGRLVLEGGVAALTTRAVATAAGVQAPTLYRLFGDKAGLLDAVAEQGMATWVAEKGVRPPLPDPVENLRRFWDEFVAFGLANPAVFAIMHAVGREPSPATRAGLLILRERVTLIAQAGLLRVPVERAVALIHAAGTGIVTGLLATPADNRDMMLPTLALDGVLASILDAGAAPLPSGPASLAVALGSRLDDVSGLTPGERALLTELLERLAR